MSSITEKKITNDKLIKITDILSKPDEEIKITDNLAKITDYVENNYIINNIIWYNQKELSLTEKQNSYYNKITDPYNEKNSISIEELNKILEDNK
jgi:hypothetical protein